MTNTFTEQNDEYEEGIQEGRQIERDEIKKKIDKCFTRNDIAELLNSLEEK